MERLLAYKNCMHGLNIKKLINQVTLAIQTRFINPLLHASHYSVRIAKISI